MEVTSLSKVVRLPLFSGLQKDFQAWWIRFVALANVCKFLAALKNGGKMPMPSSDLEVMNMTTDSGKETAAAKQRNGMAMANLTMAFEAENLSGLIYKSMSDHWPAGLAQEVIVQLFNKYSLDNRVLRVELMKIPTYYLSK
jgi:hypothetical protein